MAATCVVQMCLAVEVSCNDVVMVRQIMLSYSDDLNF